MKTTMATICWAATIVVACKDTVIGLILMVGLICADEIVSAIRKS